MPIAVLALPISASVTTRASHFVDREPEQTEERQPDAAVKKYRPKPEPISPEKRDQILRTRTVLGLSLEATAKRCGVSHRSVSRVVKDAGLASVRKRDREREA